VKTVLGLADFTCFLAKFRYKQIDDFGLLDLVRELGGDCAQVDIALKAPDRGAETRAELRAKADDLGITLVGATYGAAAPENFERAIRAGAELGAPVVRYACGPFRLWQKPVEPAALTAMLRDAAPTAEELGIALAIENHQDYTATELSGILADVDSPGVGVCLDTGNSIALLEDPLETARALAPFARQMHLKEYVVIAAPGGFDLVGVPLGEGVVDNPGVLEIVREAVPADTLYVTVENPLERCKIPAFTTDFVAEFADRPLGSLAVVTAMMERSAELRPDGVTLPQEAGLDAEEAVRIERETNEAAVRYARRELGL
jgi:sugar phosphate isomerase/epimerase